MRIAERVRYNKDLESLPARNLMEPKIVRYFAGVNLQNGHYGLAVIAKKEGLDIADLAWGEYAIFMNGSQTALKMYSRGQVIVHLRMPNKTRIDPRTIPLLPRFFSGREIRYGQALTTVIKREFNTK